MDAIYSRFVLLDLFGKIVPGSLLLISMGASMFSWGDVRQFANSMSWWLWLIFFGMSWILAFAAQSFGEAIGLLKDLPDGYTREQWYQKLKEFEAKASDREKQQAERALVIKEACGNTSVLIALCLLVWGCRSLLQLDISKLTYWFWFVAVPPLVVAAGATVFLVLMHRKQVERHRKYVEVVLGAATMR